MENKVVYIQSDIHLGSFKKNKELGWGQKLKDISWGGGVGFDISGLIAEKDLQLAELDAKLDDVENKLYLSQQRVQELEGAAVSKERLEALEECAAATKQALGTKSSEDVRRMRRAVEALETKSPLSRNR